MKNYKIIDVSGEKIIFLSNTFSIIKLNGSENTRIIIDELQNLTKSSEVQREPEIKLLELDICLTSRCNLRCSYCYANQNNLGDETDMDFKTAQRAVDYFHALFGSEVKWKIDFIGQGEPLLQFNLMLKIVDYIRKVRNPNNCNFFLITNGTLLTKDVYKTIVEYKISVGISLDGTQQTHDVYRRTACGKGTYGIIKKNLEDIFAEKEKTNLWALSVAHNGNHDIRSIIDANLKLGFKRLQTKISRVTKTTNADRKFLRDILIVQYTKLFDLLYQSILNGDMKYVFSIMNGTDAVGRLFISILQTQKAYRRCKAGFARFSVAINGDLYPCSSFYSITSCKLGNVYQKSFDQKLSATFSKENVEKTCSQCWCRYICGGVCRYASKVEFTNIYTPNDYDCDVIKHICEKIICLIYLLKKNNPKALKQLIRFSQINV